MIRKLLLLVLTLVLPTLSTAQLAPAEQQLAAYIEAGAERALALLAESVTINSGTLNLEGVRRVGDLFAPEFERLGFSVEWQDGAAWQRAGHLVARRPMAGAPRILLIGHLDTVFEADSPFQRFELLGDGRARGPGALDMKGGIVIMLQALAALAAQDTLDALDVTVVLTGDEELSGSPLALSKQALIEAAEYADIALGFEDGDGNPATANISRRGSIGWTLQVSGKPAHSSQIFSADVGSGAIFETARILDRFHDALQDEALLTFNPGIILGGSTVEYDAQQSAGRAYGKDNIVAETALVLGDLRAASPEQVARVQQRMQTMTVEGHAHTSATLTFDEGYPPMAATDGNAALLALYSKASVDLGHGEVVAVNPLAAGAADISFAAVHVDMALDGLGMGGSGGHTVDETIELALLSSQAQRTALLLYRIAHSTQ